MDEQTMKDYIEDLLLERGNLYERLNTAVTAQEEAAKMAEHWYDKAEHLWLASLDRVPTLQELWAFRDGK